jgi:hypothetical protein
LKAGWPPAIPEQLQDKLRGSSDSSASRQVERV